MKLIIGNTGLVGKTLLETKKFDYQFNSKNIQEFANIKKDGDELFLSCLPATKWIINQNIKDDVENIMNIINILKNGKYSNITLISTIDVYLDSPFGSDEEHPINFSKLHYGTNRYLFEMMVSTFLKYEKLKIFRLPGLFNKNIKKNIIFDLLNKNNLDKININSSYQWYNLDNLSSDIEKYEHLYPDESVFNLFTEPVETKDIIDIFNYENVGFFGPRSQYNYKTKFNKSGYIQTKESVLQEIKKFINE